MKYYSQARQDFIVDQLFYNKKNGFFLDLGANDGISFSNTYFFEKHRNWQGICVEPIKEVYDKLKKNRKCKVINCAIGEKTEKLTFTRVVGPSQMLSGLKKFRHQDHQKRTLNEVEFNGGKVIEEIVQCLSFKEMMSKFNVKTIDYLSIDIEGGEFEILKTINLKDFSIKIITVENNYDDKRINDFMISKGYFKILKYKADEFYLDLREKKSFSVLKYPSLWKIILLSKVQYLYKKTKKIKKNFYKNHIN